MVTWLLKVLANCENPDLSIHFDWPRDTNDITTTLSKLKDMPEIGSQTLKTSPNQIILIINCQSVRTFKSRKKFIDETESLTFELTNMLVDAGLI